MAEVHLKLKPWMTPNFAIVDAPARPRQEGFTGGPSIPLRDLHPEVLAALCAEFRAGVFAKAGKADPHA